MKRRYIVRDSEDPPYENDGVTPWPRAWDVWDRV